MRTPPPPSSSSSNSTTLANPLAGADLRNFHSPIPYLFGGLALMLALIAVSLLILACSFRNRYSSSGVDEENNSNNDKPTKMVVDLEPKIAVIMAGETNPTYLAKPVILSVAATATTTTTTAVTANHSEKQAPSK